MSKQTVNADNSNHETGERLARFLAHAGIASRRHAEALIAEGRVQVNGIPITTQGTRIDPQRDHVSVDGKPVQSVAQHVYVLLHKPAGYVTTAHDPQGRPTVLDLLPPELRALRVYPVGRLDIDTSGLLLLTNDGAFALHLSHPRYLQEKHYEALVRGHPTSATLEALRKGVTFTEDDGRRHRSAPAQVHLLRQNGPDSWLALTIHEGRKRQIRRMLSAAGHPVLHLSRVAIGSLTLKGLPLGKWRYLTQNEVQTLLSR
ncbi:MAG TPA: pseudouridine synthase [Ktedonobacteraceae bacterium]|nr:pseudouridine synthase [Ktedonobacteraceae bacterium]